MKAFFSKEFYGNTISEWLVALFIILGTLILGRIIYWFFTKILRVFTEKTKTKLDDIIIDKIEEPIVVGIVIAGSWYGVSLLNMTTQFQGHLNGLISLLIVLDVAWLIVRTVDALIEEYVVPVVEKSENNLDDAILPIARRGFSIVVWAVAVIIGLSYAGYDVATILAGLGIGGFALAIGARTALMNIFGGLNILVTQPFKIGDRIQIDEHDGYVENIGLSTTRIRTFLDNFLVTIPNKIFTDKEVVNVSAAAGSKSVFQTYLPVNTNPGTVQEILTYMKQIASTHSQVDNDCKVTLRGMNDYALIIQFIYYIKQDASFWEIQSDMNLQILKYFQEKRITIAVRNNVNIFPESVQERSKLKRNETKRVKKLLEEDDDFH